MAETASDGLIERLMEWGVDTVFGLPGDGINGFMEALRVRHGKLRGGVGNGSGGSGGAEQ